MCVCVGGGEGGGAAAIFQGDAVLGRRRGGTDAALSPDDPSPLLHRNPPSPTPPPQVLQALKHLQLWHHKVEPSSIATAYDLIDLQPDRDLLDLI